MQVYDMIMLIVLGVTAFFGFRRGLAWQVASVGAIVASYIVAMRFRDVVAPHLRATPPWDTFLAMLILYVATSFVIWVLFQLVSGIIDRLKLKEFDRQLGLLFGLAKGILLCVIITLFAVTLLGADLRRQIIDSRSGYYIAKLLNQADAIMPEELHQYLDPYLKQLDREFIEGAVVSDGEDAGQGDLQQMQDWLRKESSSLFGTDKSSEDVQDSVRKLPPATSSDSADEASGGSYYRRPEGSSATSVDGAPIERRPRIFGPR